VQWLAFPLHPETPPEGRTLQDLFAGHSFNVGQMLSHLKQVARELSLPFGDRQMTYNSRRAQEMAKWAEQEGRGDAFYDAVFRAYFVRGNNIFDLDTLMEIAKSVGLDAAVARQVIESEAFKEAVDRDWERAYESRVKAVPTFVTKGQMLVGAQPYNTLKRFVLQQPVDL
jgi:predicted DsbA family dithiol-disulfide isomerase